MLQGLQQLTRERRRRRKGWTSISSKYHMRWSIYKLEQPKKHRNLFECFGSPYILGAQLCIWQHMCSARPSFYVWEQLPKAWELFGSSLTVQASHEQASAIMESSEYKLNVQRGIDAVSVLMSSREASDGPRAVLDLLDCSEKLARLTGEANITCMNYFYWNLIFIVSACSQCINCDVHLHSGCKRAFCRRTYLLSWALAPFSVESDVLQQNNVPNLVWIAQIISPRYAALGRAPSAGFPLTGIGILMKTMVLNDNAHVAKGPSSWQHSDWEGTGLIFITGHISRFCCRQNASEAVVKQCTQRIAAKCAAEFCSWSTPSFLTAAIKLACTSSKFLTPCSNGNILKTLNENSNYDQKSGLLEIAHCMCLTLTLEWLSFLIHNMDADDAVSCQAFPWLCTINVQLCPFICIDNHRLSLNPRQPELPISLILNPPGSHSNFILSSVWDSGYLQLDTFDLRARSTGFMANIPEAMGTHLKFPSEDEGHGQEAQSVVPNGQKLPYTGRSELQQQTMHKVPANVAGAGELGGQNDVLDIIAADVAGHTIGLVVPVSSGDVQNSKPGIALNFLSRDDPVRLKTSGRNRTDYCMSTIDGYISSRHRASALVMHIERWSSIRSSSGSALPADAEYRIIRHRRSQALVQLGMYIHSIICDSTCKFV